jgi:hypothetical protein
MERDMSLSEIAALSWPLLVVLAVIFLFAGLLLDGGEP